MVASLFRQIDKSEAGIQWSPVNEISSHFLVFLPTLLFNSICLYTYTYTDTSVMLQFQEEVNTRAPAHFDGVISAHPGPRNASQPGVVSLNYKICSQKIIFMQNTFATVQNA